MRTSIKILLTIAALTAAACSTTGRLADGEVLYTGVRHMKIESTDGEKVPGNVKSAVEEPMSARPNNPLWSPYVRTPLPVGLWAWNHLYTRRTTGLRAWLYRRLSKPPVLISGVRPDLRAGVAGEILDNNGYFGSRVDYGLIQKHNPRKAKIDWHVDVAPAWYYGTVGFPPVTGPVTAAIDTMKHTSNLRPGAQYNIDTLTRERVRITNTLREESYYYFRPEYLTYEADTVRQRYAVDLRMVMAPGVPPQALRPYRIGNVRVELHSVDGAGGADSAVMDNGVNVWYQVPLRVRPRVLARALTIKPGDPARVGEINRTLNNFTRLGVFRYVNMEVTPLDSVAAGDSLDFLLTAAMDMPISADLETDFSSKTTSYIGPKMSFGVRHNNIFRGGEQLSLKAVGSYEWQTGNTRTLGRGAVVNSYEIGLNGSLVFPRLLAPAFIPRSRRYDMRTTIQMGGDLLNRPNLFTMLSASAGLSYDFQTSATSRHNLSILKLTYNTLLRTTAAFDDRISRTPALELSFRKQFIPSMSYTYTWNRIAGRGDRMVWQSTVSTAGNILDGIYSLFGVRGQKEIFGNPFAQFVKGVTEFKYFHPMGRANTLAARFTLGAGYAYGNMKVLPYTEQFFIGGANSIRAFTVRSLGPGSYHGDQYMDHTGDLKLEANVELRFRIMGGLNGAVFFDAGNIWLVRDDPMATGSDPDSRHKIDFHRFLDQIATGTGVGLRYDLSFLVIRTDLGVGIHLPYDTGRRGYYNMTGFRNSLGFHFAIGYPF